MMQRICTRCGCLIVLSLQKGQTSFVCPNCLVRYDRCPRCSKYSCTITLRRMSTCYEIEHDNYVVCCEVCFKEIEEYWQERWDDYYNDIKAGLR